jgi:hypothetical protein
MIVEDFLLADYNILKRTFPSPLMVKYLAAHESMHITFAWNPIFVSTRPENNWEIAIKNDGDDVSTLRSFWCEADKA